MKSAVVYFSLEGNTDYVAQRIAQRLGSDLLRLQPVKEYPSKGFRKFFWGGKSALMAQTPKLEPYKFDSSAYDLVVLGFPVWASTFAPPLRTFLKEHDLGGVRVAAFACQAGSGAEKALPKLEALLDGKAFEAQTIFVDPKDKPTDENESKIEAFCDVLEVGQ